MSRRANWQGMNWCRPSTRLAIYLRDGLSCVWCLKSIEQGIQLTLDHVTPVARGGTNDPKNLITACEECNRLRWRKSVPQFALWRAERYHELVFVPTIVRDTVRRVRAATRRKLPREQARKIIEARGSVPRAIEELTGEGAA